MKSAATKWYMGTTTRDKGEGMSDAYKRVCWTVILTALLLTVACNPVKSKEYQQLLAEKESLARQVKSLTAERDALKGDVEKWKVDPQANFKQIREAYESAQSSYDYQRVMDALASFEGQYPTAGMLQATTALSALASEGKKRAVAAEAATREEEEQRAAGRRAAEAATREEEEQRAARRRVDQEEKERLAGTPMTYQDFYAKVKSVGLPAGKRFRFRAAISHELFLADRVLQRGVEQGYFFPEGNLMTSPKAAFDDPGQYERLLRGPDWQDKTIVASVASGGILIHAIE